MVYTHGVNALRASCVQIVHVGFVLLVNLHVHCAQWSLSQQVPSAGTSMKLETKLLFLCLKLR